MAYRRLLFDSIGLFDPALDVGAVTNGGDDLEMFFRVVKEGHVLVCQPRAIARHRHRSDLDSRMPQIPQQLDRFLRPPDAKRDRVP
jgi:O-antigen biosynthesis protein